MSETEVQVQAEPNTGLGLLQFLDAAIEKGWLNVGSAKALRVASQKVLELEGGWENLDLRSLDVEGYLDRFQRLRRNDYSDASMRVYRSRFKQALKMHLARLDNDPNWKSYGPSPKNSTRAVGASNGTKKAPKSSTKKSVIPPEEAETPDALPLVTPQQRATLMDFPYPLREDLDVHLRLPRDLTPSEAEMLNGFIKSLAREARPATPST